MHAMRKEGRVDMQALTDEERKKLTIMLRAARPGYPPGELCVLAAEEIERLAAEVKKLRVELVERSIYD